jgi:uncharacterized protein YqeY
MTIKERLQSDLVAAMKSNSTINKNVIRGIMAAAKYAEVEKSAKIESDDDMLVIIQKEIKMRNDAIDEARKGNRNDIIESNENELKILNEYLPEQLSEAEIKEIVINIVSESGAESIKDMGKVMPLAIKAIAGRAPNGVVSKIIRDVLQN